MDKRIRILRKGEGEIDALTDESKNFIPAKGQPFYDAKTKMLYIGDGETNIKDIIDGIKNLGITSTNVRDTINNKKISDIFESNGTTIKNTTNAVNLKVGNEFKGSNSFVQTNADQTISGTKTFSNGALVISNDAKLIISVDSNNSSSN